MYRYISYTVLILVILILCNISFALESQNDELLIGKVNINKANLKLDRKSTKELEAIIAKLKIMPEHMIIKVHGDAGVLKNSDKHYYNSLLISREVVEYLSKKLGSNRDILVSAEIGTKNILSSSVSIYLIPSSLKLEKITDRYPSLNKQNQQADADSLEQTENINNQQPENMTPEEIAAEKRFEEIRQAEEVKTAEETKQADDLVAK